MDIMHPPQWAMALAGWSAAAGLVLTVITAVVKIIRIL